MANNTKVWNGGALSDFTVENLDQGSGVKRQVVHIGGSSVSGAASGLVAGAKTVTTAGTRVQLVASSTACTKIIMTAEDDNTGKIYYGGSTVSSSVGDYLFPAQKITLEIDDVNKVYIDAETNGDGVKFTYFTA